MSALTGDFLMLKRDEQRKCNRGKIGSLSIRLSNAAQGLSLQFGGRRAV
jgi:hypothetical protein